MILWFSAHTKSRWMDEWTDRFTYVFSAQGVCNQTKLGSSLGLPPPSNVTTQGSLISHPMCFLLGGIEIRTEVMVAAPLGRA